MPLEVLKGGTCLWSGIQIWESINESHSKNSGEKVSLEDPGLEDPGLRPHGPNGLEFPGEVGEGGNLNYSLNLLFFLISQSNPILRSSVFGKVDGSFMIVNKELLTCFLALNHVLPECFPTWSGIIKKYPLKLQCTFRV